MSGNIYPGAYIWGAYIRGAYNRGRLISGGLITGGLYPGFICTLLSRGFEVHTDNF